MEPETLLEELYAPDQYQVLVTCIFLNKTPAIRAAAYLEAFLRAYPTPISLQDAPLDDLKPYFRTLGLFPRAWWIKDMAEQLLTDPPKPYQLRKKDHESAGYPCEVAHLKGIGNYGSDAWRLFCKERFYADHSITITNEWKKVHPKDRMLRLYVERKQREEDMSLQFTRLNISTPRGKTTHVGVWIGDQPYALFVPKKFVDKAKDWSKGRSKYDI